MIESFQRQLMDLDVRLFFYIVCLNIKHFLTFLNVSQQLNLYLKLENPLIINQSTKQQQQQ